MSNDPRTLIDMIDIWSRTARDSYRKDKLSLYVTHYRGEPILNIHTDNGKYQLNSKSTGKLFFALDSVMAMSDNDEIDRI